MLNPGLIVAILALLVLIQILATHLRWKIARQ
jgi:UPF0716 family protein affecting phage T7 exclusion